MKQIALLFLCVCCCLQFQGQSPQFDEPHFNHLGVKEGLPEGTATRYVRDNQGYVWIGTQNGLVRYDGYKLKKYEYEAWDFNSLNIRSIYQDNASDIWIGTLNGLYKYSRRLDQVLKYYIKDVNDFEHCAVNQVRANANGELWLMYTNFQKTTCLALLKPATKQITIYSNKETGYRRLNTKNLYGILEFDYTESPWIGSDRGLLQYIPEKHSFREHILPDDPHHLNYVMDTRQDALVKNWLWFPVIRKSDNSYVAIVRYDVSKNMARYYKHFNADPHSINSGAGMYGLRDSHHQAWIVTYKGLARYDSTIDGFTNFNMQEKDPVLNQLWRAHEDLDGNLWCKGVGLIKFNIKTGKFARYAPKSQHNEDGIQAEPVLNLSIDKQGLPWFAVGQSGLQWLNKSRSRFVYYNNQEGVTNFFPGGRVQCFAEADEGNVWLGSESGLFRWRVQSGTFERVRFTTTPGNKVSIVSLTLDKMGNPWFSAYGRSEDSTVFGLYSYNIITHQTKSYRNKKDDTLSVSSNSINTLATDPGGTIWIGTEGQGLCRYDPLSGKFFRYPFIRNDNAMLPDHNALDDDQVRSLYPDKQGALWIGTNNGSLNKLTIATGEFRSYIRKIPISIISIREDSSQHIWAGTYYLGLVSLNKKTNQVNTYLEKDGLAYDGILGTEVDDFTNVWAFTRRGLSIIDQDKKSIRVINSVNGLPVDLDVQASFKLKSGHLLFGVKDGFVMLRPADFRPDTTTPQTHIESVSFPIRLPSGSYRDSVITIFGKDKISFAHDQNRITFNYVGIHYPGNSNNQYSYRLLGYDPDWVRAGTGRTVTYNNLAAGTYKFEVKAANSDGVWNALPASIMISVLPPWWKTWWARVLYIAVLCTVIYALYRNWLARATNRQRIILHQKEAQQLKALDEMKSRFFSNITHEFRTPLSLIIAPLEKMQKEYADPGLRSQLRALQQNSEQLLHLINQLLDMSKLEAKSMSTQFRRGDIAQFIIQITDSFAIQAQTAGVNLHCETGDFASDFNFDADSLRKILQNLLSNAIKFTEPGGAVTVRVQITPSAGKQALLNLDVIDTGTGIPAEHLDTIFNRFFQVDDHRTRSVNGTGLGLSIVKELTELIGGKITAHNNGNGPGTTFSLELPISSALRPDPSTAGSIEHVFGAASGENPGKEHQLPGWDRNKPTLLIVEDHADLQAFLYDLFKQDYKVLTAGNGNDGWRLAKEEMPDVIISDLMMPGMDGIEFCRLVKTSAETSHIGFIMLTAKTAQSTVLESLQSKADDYFTKPFHADELLLSVRNLVDHQAKLKAFYNRQLCVAEEPLQVAVAPDPFLENIYLQLDEHLDDPEFTIDQLAVSVHVSTRTLSRKLNAIAGITPSDLIKQYRLKKAALLLAEGTPVFDVAWMVGYGSRNYFSTAFKAFFGTSPSEYVKSGVE